MKIAIAISLALYSLSTFGQDATHEAVRKIIPTYLEYLALPNVATTSSSDIRKVAEWTRSGYLSHGIHAELLPDGETPMVYAEYLKAGADAPTVLFYAHMDGQAVNPEEWDQESPWIPVLKHYHEGQWKPLPLTSLGGEVNPEWRFFARSAADDKAPIMMLLAALDTLHNNNQTPTINIKVLLDSHEEGGPPTLVDVIKQNQQKLTADAVVMLDGPMHPSNQPTLVLGHRGASIVKLTVFGPTTDSHSGHYGNYAPNPAFMLAQLLAKMKDATGKVTIPGFYDTVAFSEDYASVLDNIPVDEEALQQRLGIAAPESVAANYQRAINYPSLNINGMRAASTEKLRTIVPAQAKVSIDIRTTVQAPAARQIELVKQFIVDQGYHLVDAEPTQEDRRQYPLLAKFDAFVGSPALQTPLNAPIGKWAERALEKVSDQGVIVLPMMGGTVPTRPLIDGLGKPVILLPLVNADNNQHAPNENLRMGNFFSGTESLYQLFLTPWNNQ